MKVLFVCTGNTCRSPMAEAIFNSVVKNTGLKHFSFSRGTSVFFSQPMNPKSQKALNSDLIDTNEHYSKQITEADAKDSDLILTMSVSHKMELKAKFPFAKNKIFTLYEKAYGKECDVEDPFGQNQDVYNKCFSDIKEAVNKLICIL